MSQIQVEYTDITPVEFEAKMTGFKTYLDMLFAESSNLEAEIKQQLAKLQFTSH